jgi:hypothetical protein
MEGMHHNVAIDPGLVRAKAYEIWQALGCPEGAAEQTWFEAERQLKSGSADPVSREPSTAARPLSEPAPAAKTAPRSEPPSAPHVAAQPKSNVSSRRTTRR